MVLQQQVTINGSLVDIFYYILHNYTHNHKKRNGCMKICITPKTYLLGNQPLLSTPFFLRRFKHGFNNVKQRDPWGLLLVICQLWNISRNVWGASRISGASRGADPRKDPWSESGRMCLGGVPFSLKKGIFFLVQKCVNFSYRYILVM